MKRISSVSQINQYIKNMFASEYALRNLYIKGEVSNCKYHTSGHIYFTLKDRTSQIACVMFAGQRKGLPFRLENGQSVVVFGSIQVYERDGRYQLYASQIMADGSGLLYEQYEALKKRLLEEGLFEKAHKKDIPPYVAKVGIITADTGAAIQDICNIASRRNPYVQLYLYPAKVQGEGAAETLIQGLQYFDTTDVDVVILGRGGGSMEDLWAFNEEALARAVYKAKKPVVSAVGHETDTTIVDYVSDLRAPTPSAAAELVVYPIEVVLVAFQEYEADLERAMERRLQDYRQILERYGLLIENLSPVGKLQNQKQKLDGIKSQLEILIRHKLGDSRQKLSYFAGQLEALSPPAKIAGGYAYVTDDRGSAVRSVRQVKAGQMLEITFSDGSVQAVVQDKSEV